MNKNDRSNLIEFEKQLLRPVYDGDDETSRDVCFVIIFTFQCSVFLLFNSGSFNRTSLKMFQAFMKNLKAVRISA